MLKKLCTLLLAFVLQCSVVACTSAAQSAVYTSENFNSYVSSGVPNASGFSGKIGDGSIEYSPSYEGWGNCMRMYSAGGEAPFINISLNGIPSVFSVNFNLMFAGDAQEREIHLRASSNELFPMLETRGGLLYIFGEETMAYDNIEFYDFRFDIDLLNGTYMAFAYDEKIAEGNVYPGLGSKITGIKIIQKSDGSGSSLFLDNFSVYRGDAPQKPERVSESSMDVSVKNILNSAVAFFNRSDEAWVYGNRLQMDESGNITAKITDGGVAMVPLQFAVEALGGTVETANEEILIHYKEKTIKAKLQSDVLIADNQNIKMPEALTYEDACVYVPAKALSGVLGKSYFFDDHGLILISDKSWNEQLAAKHTLLDELIKTVCYERPARDAILEDFVNAGKMNSHPSILIDEDGFERIRNLVAANDEVKKWYEQIKRSADTLLENETVYHARSDGRRLDYGQRVLTQILPPLLIVYNISGETKYAEKAWAHMEAICGWPEWGNASAEHLNVAELSSAMVMGYDWLYDYLTPAQREMCKVAIVNKGVKVGINFYEQNQWWSTSEWNWNMSMAGGLTLAALSMLSDEPFVCSQLISYTLRSAESSLATFYPDGSWDEGMSYWKYTIMNLCNMVSSLDIVLGNDYGIFNTPSLDETPTMPLHYTGPVGVFNFHDTGEEEHAPELAYFAKKLKKPGIMYQLYSTLQTEAPRFKDLLWFDPDYMDASGSDIPLDKYYGSVETMFMHQNWSKGAIYTGLHAGDNTVGHAHMDSGNFIIDANGERWIIDPGKDNLAYRQASWADRFNVWAIRTEAHNCVVINPDETAGQIEQSNSPIIAHESKERGAYAIADLTPAYAGAVKQYHRGLMFTDNRRAVVVRDEIKSSKENDIYWSISTKANVQISEDGRSALLTQNGKNFYVTITEGEGTFEVRDAAPLETSPNPEGQVAFNGVKKLEIWRKNVTNMTLSVAFIPLTGTDTEPYQIPKAMPLSEWEGSIPDGVIIYPELSDIQLDGESIAGFDKDKKDYTCRLTAEEELPEVTAYGENVDINIQYSGDYIVSANITVTNKDDKSMSAIYQIMFYREAKQIVLDQNNKLAIKAVTVSAEPQPENNAANAIDGKLGTRWSAENEQWLQVELQEISDISYINICTYLGNERSQLLDIEISEDGENYTTVFTGATSGTTDGMEAIPIETVRGKYVRLLCHGTDKGTWNSICEIEVYR